VAIPLASFHDVRRHKLGKAVQPETCGLGLAVPELPWLYNLVIAATDLLKRVAMRDRVFDALERDASVQE
jgi:hypothetical protein